MPNLILVIAHNVFLNRKERYDLQTATTVEVIGINTPVWYYSGRTSEPATEVFAKYRIVPTKETVNIKNTDKGFYEIELPVNSYNEENKRGNPVVLRTLKDYKDGGSEWAAFRQYSRLKRNKRNIQIVHFVEIKDVDELTNTLVKESLCS